MKSFLGVGNTCVVCHAYENELGITSGYSRGRYMLHYHGEWPDEDKMLDMFHRNEEKKKAKTAKTPGASTSPLTVD